MTKYRFLNHGIYGDANAAKERYLTTKEVTDECIFVMKQCVNCKHYKYNVEPMRNEIQICTAAPRNRNKQQTAQIRR